MTKPILIYLLAIIIFLGTVCYFGLIAFPTYDSVEPYHCNGDMCYDVDGKEHYQGDV